MSSLPKCSFGTTKKRNFGASILAPFLSKAELAERQKKLDVRNINEENYQKYKNYYCGPYTPDFVCRRKFNKSNPQEPPTTSSTIQQQQQFSPNIMGPLKSGPITFYFVVPTNSKNWYIQKELSDLMKQIRAAKNQKASSFGTRSKKAPKHGFEFGFKVLRPDQIIEKTYRNPFGSPDQPKNPSACLAYGRRRSRVHRKAKSKTRKTRRRRRSYGAKVKSSAEIIQSCS